MVKLVQGLFRYYQFFSRRYHIATKKEERLNLDGKAHCLRLQIALNVLIISDYKSIHVAK